MSNLVLIKEIEEIYHLGDPKRGIEIHIVRRKSGVSITIWNEHRELGLDFCDSKPSTVKMIGELLVIAASLAEKPAVIEVEEQ